MTAGHLGEFIASRVFAIELEASASAAAIDGRFTEGLLAGRTVNVKWYAKREGLLDLTESDVSDHYLVLTGPPSAGASSRGQVRPWIISNVYLFEPEFFATTCALAAGAQAWPRACVRRPGPRPRCIRANIRCCRYPSCSEKGFAFSAPAERRLDSAAAGPARPEDAGGVAAPAPRRRPRVYLRHPAFESTRMGISWRARLWVSIGARCGRRRCKSRGR